MAERLRGRRCLVTGATGFLGQRLVPRLLAAGAEVTVVARDERAVPAGVRVRVGDLEAPGWAEATRREWCWDDVVHLAGPVFGVGASFEQEASLARRHLTFALALDRAIPASWPGRLIHASSMTVYGAPGELPIPESRALAPRFLYALGKVLAEDVWQAAARPDCWRLRLPGLFSAERRSGALHHFVSAGLAGRPLRITAPEPTPWDVLHVEDAADAITRALQCAAPFSGALNVSYGEAVDLEGVAHRIAELTTGAPVVNESGASHPPFQLDISRARERLAWPPCGLEQRLAELVATLASAAHA